MGEKLRGEEMWKQLEIKKKHILKDRKKMLDIIAKDDKTQHCIQRD